MIYETHSPFFPGIPMKQRRIYPLNALGDFYVEEGMCIACKAPEHEAPDLMSHDPAAHAGYHCFFKRQPATKEELERAIRAVAVGCCGAVRYAGNDGAILRCLADLGSAEACDRRLTSG